MVFHDRLNAVLHFLASYFLFLSFGFGFAFKFIVGGGLYSERNLSIIPGWNNCKFKALQTERKRPREKNKC